MARKRLTGYRNTRLWRLHEAFDKHVQVPVGNRDIPYPVSCCPCGELFWIGRLKVESACDIAVLLDGQGWCAGIVKDRKAVMATKGGCKCL